MILSKPALGWLALFQLVSMATALPSLVDMQIENLSSRNNDGLASHGKRYSVEQLWSMVEKDNPVEYAKERKVRKGPFDIEVPPSPSSFPYLTPTYKSFNDTKAAGLKFPPGFKYGVASAAAQVEGAVKEGGRGPSTWDYVAHQYPDQITDRSTPDITDNAYYLYEYDIARIKAMGVRSYSVSFSWSRVLPLGKGDVSEAGLDYYDRLIDAIIEAGIEPMITLFHWDVPLALELEYGSYRSAQIIRDFKAYAKIIFERYGQKVKHFVTHNEPGVFCPRYEATLPLNATNPTEWTGQESRYRCSYHLLKAHGDAVKLYKDMQQQGQVAQDGEIGIKLENSYPLPWDAEDPNDVEIAARHEAFNVGIWAEPIYGSGDWPQLVKDVVPENMLPNFSEEDKQLIKGSADYFALDGYDVRIAKSLPEAKLEACKRNTSYPDWPVCSDNSKLWYSQGFKNGYTLGQQADPLAPWLYNAAGAMRWYGKKLLEQYPSPKYYLSEFGFAEPYEVNKTGLHAIREDTARTQYFIDYVSELLLSIHEDGVPWAGFFAWSPVDNWEWYIGKRLSFGLQYVNFSSPTLEREYKRSFVELRDFMQDRLE